MKRRDAMKKVVAIMGASLSASTLLVFQQSCKSDTNPQPGTFTEKDSEMLSQIGEIIIPETDTPGAAAVNIGAFSVMMLEECYPQEARDKVISFLSEISPGFKGKSHDNQLKQIRDIDTLVYDEENKKGKYEGYKIIKELTMLGYFTSEPGMTEALSYVKVPGRYEGCVDLKPGQKAWA
jgi:hypothetical protein